MMESRNMLCVMMQLVMTCCLCLSVTSQKDSEEDYGTNDFLDDDYDSSPYKELLNETRLLREEIEELQDDENADEAMEEHALERLEETTRQLAAMMKGDGSLLRHIRGIFLVDKFNNNNHNWTLLKKGLAGVLDHNSVAYEQLQKLLGQEEEDQMNKLVENGYKELLEVLLDYGLYVDTPEPETLNDTFLHLAAWYNQEDMVKILLDRGASTSARNNLGDTPLILAAFRNNLNVVKLLEQSGADLDDPNDYERTSLHYAAEKGFVDVVRYLVENGASTKPADNDLLTPLDLAKKGGYQEIVNILS